MNKTQALNEITDHITNSNHSYSQWYVGITSDVDQRLHGDHKVPKEGHWFITREIDSENDARQVEQSLLSVGCDGGPGGGDQTATVVYAYLKGPQTSP